MSTIEAQIRTNDGATSARVRKDTQRVADASPVRPDKSTKRTSAPPAPPEGYLTDHDRAIIESRHTTVEQKAAAYTRSHFPVPEHLLAAIEAEKPKKGKDSDKPEE